MGEETWVAVRVMEMVERKDRVLSNFSGRFTLADGRLSLPDLTFGVPGATIRLAGGYALKITTGKWFTPSGRSIHRDRKLLPDGRYVEVIPDSLETDSVRASNARKIAPAGLCARLRYRALVDGSRGPA